MTATMIGYARCSTDEQDLTAQRQLLLGLGVAPDRIYLDHGVTGTTRNRPGLDQALAAVRAGDTLVVPKLDRLARSVPDARAIGDSLVARGVKLSLGGTVYDPTDPMGKLFFNILATVAEFEVDLLRLRTREGMAIARAKGRLRGKQPKMSARQQAHWSSSIRAGSIRSPSWPNCSRSRGPRCIGCWNAPVAPAPACRPATLRSAAHSLPQQ
jgi:DNA invertase Pin-like site-specific DNA recombinase